MPDLAGEARSGAEFRTEDGRRVPAVTVAEMREIDRIAVDELGPNLFQMMENAGRNLAEEAMSRLGSDPPTVLALAGSGGNGAGVICAARHLANHGVDVQLLLAFSEDRLATVPSAQLALYRATGRTEIGAGTNPSVAPSMILDGLIGYGLRGAPSGEIARLIVWTHGVDAPVLSLDVQSGIDGDTGAAPGLAIRPAATVTLALPKTGLAFTDTGDLVLADIGIPKEVFRRAGIAYVSPFVGKYRVGLEVYRT